MTKEELDPRLREGDKERQVRVTGKVRCHSRGGGNPERRKDRNLGPRHCAGRALASTVLPIAKNFIVDQRLYRAEYLLRATL